MLHSWVFEYCTRVVFDITCLRMSRENGVAWPSTILTDNESLHQKSHSDVLKPEVVSCKVQHSSKDRAEKRWVFEGGKSPRRFWWRIHSLSIFSSPKEWVLLILCQMATHAIFSVTKSWRKRQILTFWGSKCRRFLENVVWRFLSLSGPEGRFSWRFLFLFKIVQICEFFSQNYQKLFQIS